jgi:hypothetical protein
MSRPGFEHVAFMPGQVFRNRSPVGPLGSGPGLFVAGGIDPANLVAIGAGPGASSPAARPSMVHAREPGC